ncbi:MAG: hypothetical protein MJ060_05510, partial [Clostridia bacterium]|nr:hypothetical protein [Clostridia bacterium]
MEKVSTLIEFVAKNVPASDPVFPAAVTTGDVVGYLVAAIFAMAFIAISINFALRKTVFAHKNTSSKGIASKNFVIAGCIFAILSLLTFGCTLSGLMQNVFADDPALSVKANEKVLAVVDKETGEISIEPGSLQKVAEVADVVTLNNVNLKYIDEISISDKCNWQVFVSDTKCYD